MQYAFYLSYDNRENSLGDINVKSLTKFVQAIVVVF